MVETRLLTESLLSGNFFHCRPVDKGPTVKAQIITSEENISPMFKKVIICPERQPASRCRLRDKARCSDKHCYILERGLSGFVSSYWSWYG